MNTQHQTYSLTPGANWDRVGPQYTITVAPKLLLQHYGYPASDNDSESLGTYVFSSQDGAVVTVYQRAYDMFPLFIKAYRWWFWRSENPTELTVAAEQRSHAEDFCRWLSLSMQLEAAPR